MPEDDVSDLRDVVDAINKLCDTMKTSTYDEPYEDCSPSESSVISQMDFSSETIVSNVTEEIDVQYVEYRDVELVSPAEVTVQKVEVYSAERWSDSTSQVSLPGQVEDFETVTSDTEPVLALCEPTSEMYFTASSEVSLLSDTELPEKVLNEDETKDDRKECVIAGHVAAMRERFESMTRTNTPCPDLIRSLSPSLEVFRNASPSPDRLA